MEDALAHLNAKDVLDEQHLAFYEKGMTFFYLQLVHLNVNVFILEHVLQFPFELFTVVGESIFFRMVFENFFHASLLIITRITTDQGSGLFTLPRFKNNIRQCVRSEHQASFDNRLRNIRFDKETQTLLERADGLRNERIAHASETIALGEAEDTRVTFGEIKVLRDKLESLLDALSFNVERMMLPVEYSSTVRHPPDMDNRPDIEVILDLIAERSALLNMPEDNPQMWVYQRERLSEDEIRILNQYRSKFNLPAV